MCDRDSSKFAPLTVKLRHDLENLVRRRCIFFPAFEIYGGYGGLYDLGPLGSKLKHQIELAWRSMFIEDENLLEVSCTNLTPRPILEASGHVERFTDLMVTDPITGEFFRADKLLELVIQKKLDAIKPELQSSSKNTQPGAVSIADLMQREAFSPRDYQHLLSVAGSCTKSEMAYFYDKLEICNPNNNNPLSPPIEFNLMFDSQLGPKKCASTTCYLRPECAQGIIVNFKKLLEYNRGLMPFGCAQFGLGFRNEIAPRNGLLRLREFNMAEIEYFVHPEDKSHPKFASVEALIFPLHSKRTQLDLENPISDMSLGEAVMKTIIANESLAYFMARTWAFAVACGLSEDGLRFRQHLDTEKAHYASDCWDLEVLTSHGWIECVGHADRSAYDLSQHIQATKIPLHAYKRLDEAQTHVEWVWTYDKKVMCNSLKSQSQPVMNLLDKATDEVKKEIEKKLSSEGKCLVQLGNDMACEVTRAMVKLEQKTVTMSEEPFIPHIIEPSFGLTRILYCILEHTYRARSGEDRDRTYFAFPPQVAPIKCSVLMISNNSCFASIASELIRLLKQARITYYEDNSSATIGKRYARTDELGIPFALTIDFQSLSDCSVTLRERDSMNQIRLNAREAVKTIGSMINGDLSWTEVYDIYPHFSISDSTKA